MFFTLITLTISTPTDPYFNQTFIPDFQWELFTDEEIEDIYDEINQMNLFPFQGPSRPSLQGPDTPPIQGPYLSNRLFNSEDPF